jgi:hypothetical protein
MDSLHLRRGGEEEGDGSHVLQAHVSVRRVPLGIGSSKLSCSRNEIGVLSNERFFLPLTVR